MFRCLCIFIIVFLTTLPAYAEKSWIQGELGYRIASFAHDEDDGAEEDGILQGAFLSFSHYDGYLLEKLEGEFFLGQLDFEGEDLNDAPFSTESDNIMASLRGIAGRPFKTRDRKTQWMPYGGLAYRYWRNDVGSNGFTKQRQTIYSPLGLELRHQLSKTVQWGFSAEYNFLWWGWTTFDVDEFNSNYDADDATLGPGKGQGFQGNVFVSFDDGVYSYMIRPFFRFWSRDESSEEDLTSSGTKIGTIKDEEATTLMYGLALVISF